MSWLFSPILKCFFFPFLICYSFIEFSLVAQDWAPPISIPDTGYGTISSLPQIAMDLNGNAIAIWYGDDSSNTIIQTSSKPFNGNWQSVPTDIFPTRDNTFFPQIAMDPNGNAIAVWQNSSTGRIQAATYNGSWQPSQDISPAGESSTNPQIAMDANGNGIAVWQNDTTEFIQVAIYNGSWQPFENISPFGETCLFPQIAMDANGNGIAIWQNNDFGLIQASVYVGIWQFYQDISPVGQISGSPQIAMDPNGNAIAVWMNISAGFIIQATTYNGSWQPSQSISPGGQFSLTPQIAIDPNGNGIAVWRNLANNRIQAATYNGSWQPSQNISPSGEISINPQIAIDPNGNAISVWQNASIGRIQASTYNGSWQSPQDISPAGEFSNAPQIAIDSNGNAIAVWQNGSTDRIQAATYNGSWQTPQDISPAGESSSFPQIAIDPNGNAIAVWQNDFSGRIQAATYNGSWQVPQDISPVGGNSSASQIAIDPNGNAIAVWQNGSTGRIQAATYNGSWQPSQDISPVGGNSSAPQIAIDLNGDAIAVWQNTSIGRIQAATYNGSWQTPQDISPAGEFSNAPQIAIDLNGDATAVWQNISSGLIQANKKLINGNWQVIPTDLSQAGKNAFNPQIAIDESGNAVVLWKRIVLQSSTEIANVSITSIFPDRGSVNGGELVIIKGTNFTGDTSVLFGGVLAFSINIVDLNTIEAITPPHAQGLVDVTIQNAFGSVTLTNGYLYEDSTPLPPILAFVSPSQALPGTLLTLIGSNFQPGIQVLFGDVIAQNVIYLDSSTIQVLAPANPPGPISITLINPDGGEVTIPNAFVYGIPSPLAPIVRQVTPNSGPSSGENQVTILGENFTGTEVYFGTTSAAFIRLNDNTIIAIAPPGEGIVDISVITDFGIGTLVLAYTYLPVPPSPPTPVLPPSPVRGSIKKAKARFATQTDLINVVEWHAPRNDSSIVAYHVFRNSSLRHSIASISANRHRLQFEDHNRKKGRSYTYYIVSIDAQGNQSLPLIIHAPSF